NQHPPAALAPRAAVRPRERGLKVEGRINGGATGVKLKILDANGNIVQLRQDIAAAVAVQEINGTLAAPAAGMRNFEAAVFFADAVNTFGPVQIFVISEGLN